MTRRPSWYRRRAWLVALGILLGLAMSEGAFQLLRLWNLDRWEESSEESDEGRYEVVAVGDSHTYGLGVHPGVESFPVRLKALLNGRHRHGPFVVENLGFPARNTALVRDRLEQRLTRSRPDLVLVLAGFNNSWNPTEPSTSSSTRWWHRLILPRLIGLWTAPSTKKNEQLILKDGEIQIIDSDGRTAPATSDEARKGLRQDSELAANIHQGLAEIVDLCREWGVDVILQTYASEQNDVFRIASEAARAVAKEKSVALVDHARWFASKDGDGLDLFQSDGHPTVHGYRWMAESLFEHLSSTPTYRTVHRSFGSTGKSPDDTENQSSMRLGSFKVQTDGTMMFPLEGPPGEPWWLALASDLGEGPAPLELDQDELFAFSHRRFGLFGSFDDEGKSTARIYPSHFQKFSGQDAYAQLLVLNPFTDKPDEMVVNASDVAKIKLP